MKIWFTTLASGALLTATGLFAALPPGAGRGPGPLTEQEIVSSETQVVLEAEQGKLRRLAEKLSASESSVADLQKSLVIANNEMEVYRKKAATLMLRLEAIGIGGAGGNTGKLEQRLLTAVSDLKLAEDENKKLKEALVRLSEAVLTYQKVTVSSSPENRLALEAEMRGAAKALGVAPPQVVEAVAFSSTITDGLVISIKEDIALVVANLGTNQGVKVGMPFRVTRNGKTIGTVRVVDVREKIAGAVIENLSSDKGKVEVGDRLMVEAQQ